MSKNSSKKKRDSASTICGGCKLKVKSNDGVQCQGPCAKWRHYHCMDVSECKLQAIRNGEIQIRCPCPNCEPPPTGMGIWRAPCCRGLPCASDANAKPQSETEPFAKPRDSTQTTSSTKYTNLYDTTAVSEPTPSTDVYEADVHVDAQHSDDLSFRPGCRNPECDPRAMEGPGVTVVDRRSDTNFADDGTSNSKKSTDQLRKSLTELRTGFDDLKVKQEAVELCFESVRQMCEAVDNLAEKINEVVERVKETVEETERERSRAVSRRSSQSSQGRMCYCPANPSPPE